MKITLIENILNGMVETLDEFKSQDTTYYKKQVSKIITYLKKKGLNNEND